MLWMLLILKGHVLNTTALIPDFSYKDLCNVAIRGFWLGPEEEAAGVIVNKSSEGVGTAHFKRRVTGNLDWTLFGSVPCLFLFFSTTPSSQTQAGSALRHPCSSLCHWP